MLVEAKTEGGKTTYASKAAHGVRRMAPAVKVYAATAAAAAPSTETANTTSESTTGKLVWMNNVGWATDLEISRAVEQRLKGQPVEGRVVSINRMKKGSAAVVELDSEECVTILNTLGLFIGGVDIRLHIYDQHERTNNRSKP